VLKIFLFIIVALFMFPSNVEAAVLTVSAEKNAVQIGEEVALKIGVDTQGERVNIFNLAFTLPEQFSLVRLNKENSAVNIWIQEPKYDEAARTVSLVGGVPGGLLGSTVLLEVAVKINARGSYALSLAPQSEIYLNDGLGTRGEIIRPDFSLEVKGKPSKAGVLVLVRIAGFAALALIILAVILWRLKRMTPAKSL